MEIHCCGSLCCDRPPAATQNSFSDTKSSVSDTCAVRHFLEQQTTPSGQCKPVLLVPELNVTSYSEIYFVQCHATLYFKDLSCESFPYSNTTHSGPHKAMFLMYELQAIPHTATHAFRPIPAGVTNVCVASNTLHRNTDLGPPLIATYIPLGPRKPVFQVF